MAFDPHRHWRRSIRLREFDYRFGTFFITIVAFGRRCVFGDIVDGDVVPSRLGGLVEENWLASAELRPELQLGSFIVMPNHIHALVQFDRTEAPQLDDSNIGAKSRGPARRSLGAFIANYKAAVTRTARAIGVWPADALLWQRGYFDRIVRDEAELSAIEAYILDNPLRWQEDPERP